MKDIISQSSYTQTELAERLGISQPRLNQYLSGKNEPDIAFIVKFCDFFNITPNDLLGYGTNTASTDMYDRTTQIVKIVEDYFNAHHVKMDSDKKAQLIAGLITNTINIPQEEQIKYIEFYLKMETNKRAV